MADTEQQITPIDLEGEVKRLSQRQLEIEQMQSDLNTQREDLIEGIKSGKQTSGDKIRDFIFACTGEISKDKEAQLREIYKRISEKVGQRFLVVEERISTDLNKEAIGETIYFGTVSGKPQFFFAGDYYLVSTSLLAPIGGSLFIPSEKTLWISYNDNRDYGRAMEYELNQSRAAFWQAAQKDGRLPKPVEPLSDEEFLQLKFAWKESSGNPGSAGVYLPTSYLGYIGKVLEPFNKDATLLEIISQVSSGKQMSSLRVCIGNNEAEQFFRIPKLRTEYVQAMMLLGRENEIPRDFMDAYKLETGPKPKAVMPQQGLIAHPPEQGPWYRRIL